MRFDWYAATVLDEPESVLATLSHGLEASVVEGAALNGYLRGFDLRTDGSTVARLLCGGRNGPYPHVFASSDHTDRFVEVIRTNWPETHRVTRMDASEDFDGPGSWDRLYPVLLGLADERRLKVDQAGDWHRLEDGRTFYVGGRKSAVFARLYEKGKQLRQAEGRVGEPERFSADLVRLEVQVRPDGEARYRAAMCAPPEAYGYADWTRELASRVFGLDVERVHIRERRVSDDVRAIEWMVLQYGEHLERMASEMGGWGAVAGRLRRIRARQLERRGLEVPAVSRG